MSIHIHNLFNYVFIHPESDYVFQCIVQNCHYLITQIVSTLVIGCSLRKFQCSFENSHPSWHTFLLCGLLRNSSHVLVYFSCPSPGVSPFSLVSWFFWLKSGLQSPDGGSRCIATEVSLILGLLSRWTAYVCVLARGFRIPCLFACLSVALYIEKLWAHTDVSCKSNTIRYILAFLLSLFVILVKKYHYCNWSILSLLPHQQFVFVLYWLNMDPVISFVSTRLPLYFSFKCLELQYYRIQFYYAHIRHILKIITCKDSIKVFLQLLFAYILPNNHILYHNDEWDEKNNLI